jgi:hypothetical protein
MVADPVVTPVTSPASETVATAVFDDDHVTVAPDITVPPRSLTVGVSVAVAPIDVIESEVGVSSTLDATWATTTAAVPSATPEIPMIVAVPLLIVVTSPASETVATSWEDEAHVTVAPATTEPAASFTVALNVAVSPIDTKTNEAGENSTVDST